MEPPRDNLAKDLNAEAEQQAVPDVAREIANDRFARYMQIFATAWFYLSNLCIGLWGLRVSHATLPNLATFGLLCQAAVLGVWLGVGRSPLWMRWLLFGFSYYYFAFYLRSHEIPDSRFVFPVAFAVLMLAAEIATLRAILVWAYPSPRKRQFTLGELFGAMAAAGVVLAIWSGPTRFYVLNRAQFGGVFSDYHVGLFGVGFATYITIIALPLFVYVGKSRFRACFFSLVLMWVFAFSVAALQAILAGRSAGQAIEINAFVIVAIVLFFLVILPAEIALAWWKIRLVRPVEGEEPVEASQMVNTDPLGMETEAP